MAEPKKCTYNTFYPRKCARLIRQLYSSSFRRDVRSGCHCRSIRNPHFLPTRYVLVSHAIERAISYMTFLCRCCESRHVVYLMSSQFLIFCVPGQDPHAVGNGKSETWSHGQLQEYHCRRRVRCHSSSYIPQLTDIVQIWKAIPRYILNRTESSRSNKCILGLVPPLLLEAPKRAVKLYVPLFSLICPAFSQPPH